MIVSAAHSADVVLRGRRRETRKQYRIDVPIEFQQVTRKELAPAIEIRLANFGSVVVSSFAGRLWRPHVRGAGRVAGTINFLGRYAEDNAMTEAEMAAWAGGAVTQLRRGFTHDDPLERPRGIYTSGYNGRWIAAQDLPVLVDDEVKSVLWSDRPAIEQRLRRSAESILIVDGKVWTELAEPALTLAKDTHGGRRAVHVHFQQSSSDGEPHALRHFRLDRMEDMLDWARHQGSSVVPVAGLRDPSVALVDEYRIIEPWSPKRDDARILLASRLYRTMTDGGALVSLLPSVAVDSFIALKRFWLQPDDCAASTPELYGHLKTLGQAIEALSGLSAEAFDHRRKAREGFSPVLARWHSHEEARYARAEALTP